MPYVINNPAELHVIYYATGLVELPELSEGLHSLTVYLEAALSGNYVKTSYADTVYFVIDLTPPNASILSPVNKTYTAANIIAANISLSFTLNENMSQVTYSLDGYDNITIAGNTTLKGLSTGSHNVTVYSRDLAGNTGASETVNFTIVAEPEPQSEPFPTVPVVAASAVSVAVVAVGLLVYFKKRNHDRINRHSEIEQSST
jgi:hypothetical protein